MDDILSDRTLYSGDNEENPTQYEYYRMCILSDVQINEHETKIKDSEIEIRQTKNRIKELENELNISRERGKYCRWLDMNQLERFSAICLGFSEETWGLSRGRWREGRTKEKFPKWVGSSWKDRGVTLGGESDPLYRTWNSLTPIEKAAAITLGFSENDFEEEDVYRKEAYKSNIKKLEEKIDNLEKQVNNIDVNNLCLQKTYENKVIRLEKKIEELKNENKKHNDITEKGINKLETEVIYNQHIMISMVNHIYKKMFPCLFNTVDSMNDNLEDYGMDTTNLTSEFNTIKKNIYDDGIEEYVESKCNEYINDRDKSNIREKLDKCKTLKELTTLALKVGFKQEDIDNAIEKGNTGLTILKQKRNAHSNLYELLYIKNLRNPIDIRVLGLPVSGVGPIFNRNLKHLD